MPVPRELLKRPAGEFVAAYFFDEEHRAIIRAHMAETRISRVALAGQIGITDRQLKNFLDGCELFDLPGMRVRKWCEGKAVPDFIAPETIALAILGRWAHKSKVRRMRRDIAAAVRAVYAQHGVKVSRYAEGALDE